MARSQPVVLKLALLIGLAFPVSGFAQSAGGLPTQDPPKVYVGSIGSPSVPFESVKNELLSSPKDQLMYGSMTLVTFLALGLIPLIQMVRIAMGTSDRPIGRPRVEDRPHDPAGEQETPRKAA